MKNSRIKIRKDLFQKLKYRLIFSVVIFSLIPGINGCSIFQKKEKGWKPVTQKTASFTHTVKWPRETLQIISKWYTGNSNNWKAVADANPAIDPDILRTGNTVYIPGALLKTDRPMPETFIKEYYGKFTKSKFKSKPKFKKNKPKKKLPKPVLTPKLKDTPQDEDDFELFGPR